MAGSHVYKEGQRFPFQITNKLVLPGTDEVHFVLRGPDGRKHLLPEADYHLYHLREGQTVTCTVDKINCSGKVFLEPDHPYYRIGERYDFLVMRIVEEESFLGSVKPVAWVRDLHGLEWPCPIDTVEGIEPGFSHLACKVEKIRRARLHLSLPSLTNRFSTLKTGRSYRFKLTDVKTIDNKEYYIFRDYTGSFHRLPLALYKNYGFKANTETEAQVIRYNPDGECIIEPRHPYYQTGKAYRFKFIRIERSVDLFGKIEAVLYVEDIHGNELKVKPESWQVEQTGYHPGQILCRVTRLRKGRPVLKIIEKKRR